MRQIEMSRQYPSHMDELLLGLSCEGAGRALIKVSDITSAKKLNLVSLHSEAKCFSLSRVCFRKS